MIFTKFEDSKIEKRIFLETHAGAIAVNQHGSINRLQEARQNRKQGHSHKHTRDTRVDLLELHFMY